MSCFVAVQASSGTVRHKADRICDLLLPMNQHGAEGTESFVVSAVLHRKDDKSNTPAAEIASSLLSQHSNPVS